MNINPENRSAIRKPIPTKFDEELDPFFSPENMKYLDEAIKRVENGQYSVHDIIEVDED
ncbi:MAG: hypothetical protein LBL93_03660 [Ruminococcus sp.]|jgi:hypothetical protein|nr:hypothetical protein [Ruminococcus sp.]